MPKFIVSMTRIGYASTDIEVEAVDAVEAQEKAGDEAGNHDYSEHHADYECEGITEVQEEPLLPADLMARAAADPHDPLDDLVHDLVSQRGSTINNEGAESQVRFIILEMGKENGVKAIREVLE